MPGCQSAPAERFNVVLRDATTVQARKRELCLAVALDGLKVLLRPLYFISEA